MGYKPVKGGAAAIRAAAQLTGWLDLDDREVAIEVEQIRHQLGGAVERVMSEGGLYAPDLAALAIKQAEGDLSEAALLLRAYRSTLPRLGYALATSGRAMCVQRRISSAFKDVPGGQVLGRTRDYTHRLLDFSLLQQGRRSGKDNGVATANGHTQNGHTANGHLETGGPTPDADAQPDAVAELTGWPAFPKVSDTLRGMGLMTPIAGEGGDGAPGDGDAAVHGRVADADEPFDVTRDALRYPVPRSAWLQALARGETGAMVCLAYSNLRGYGFSDHGTIGELRVGVLPLRVVHPLTRHEVTVGWYRATEVEMFGPEQDRGSGEGGRSSAGRGGGGAGSQPPGGGRLLPNFGLSYGLVIGQQERKAIAMSILDSALQAAALHEGDASPSNDQEMVLSHVDGIESAGFVEHLKLPHYVTFGAAMRAQKVPLGTRAMIAAGQALTQEYGGEAPVGTGGDPDRWGGAATGASPNREGATGGAADGR